MTSLERGLDVLGHIAEHGPATAEFIAEKAGLPLSTTYRYMVTLRSQGYIADYGGHFDLGVRMLRMLKPAALNRCLATMCSPAMFDLVAKTGETALLTVREGWTATCIAQAEPHRAVRFSFRRGVSLSLHKGASAKPLLANSDAAFIHRYLDRRVGWEEGLDPANNWADLSSIRERGFAVTTSELDSGALGIGVPVFWDGEIAACLSTVGPTSRLTERRLKEAVANTIATGKALTDMLMSDNFRAALELQTEAGTVARDQKAG
jgi:DNA-binding IclR family transcriptional regulator